MQQVTAILVTYNSAQVIARALASLAGCPHLAAITVVDNASADGTRALIRQKFPHVSLLENPSNEGFGRANNRALGQVKTPYALLVNPDAALETTTISDLLEAAARYPDAAILAPLLYDETGKLHHSHKRSVFAREKKRDIFTAPEGDTCADFLSGAVWLLNMNLLRQTGFFDPQLFLYYEDDDLCLRVRKAGYAPVLVHGAKAMHAQGASSGGYEPKSDFFRQQQMIRSRLYIEEKYKGQAAAKRLAKRLHAEYALKTLCCRFLLKKKRVNRYRGRMAGIAGFTLSS